ncbi:uncharacterized protein LOC106643282 [Copidosoma floridanum]|uniref:uncharacterized protein LOC106643282 n=1 Tax=Copidosoma floridanum TaxID=29053 RepID=UPI0006C9738F|nr:uncharacterized protein LOC106643282 [Copidosoma floridanum]
MPRKPSRFDRKASKKKRLCYPQENVALALKDLRKGERICQLVRKYGIPASTIRAKSSGLHSDKPGPTSIFTAAEEKRIADWIFHQSAEGFNITKTHLLECVRMLCIKTQRKNPFPNNVPGRSWYENYLKRFPKLAVKIAENFAASRLTFSKDKLSQWFRNVSSYLCKKGVADLGPERIFNCADIELPLHPHSVKDQTRNKKPNSSDDKESVSVLFTCNATGKLAPTLILLAGEALPIKVAAADSKDYVIGFSENGTVLAPNFYEFITKIFEPWLKKNNTQLPVIIYIDGHSPFLNFYLTDFCSANGIVLVPLYNNALHIIQPLDVAFFETFKSQWIEMCEEFFIGMHQYQVASLVKRILNSICISDILQEGFRKCGLNPFDINAVDFLKNKKKKQNLSKPRLIYDLEISNRKAELTQNCLLSDFEKFLSQHQIQLFRANDDPIWKGETKYEALFNIWYKLSQFHNFTSNNSILTNDESNNSETSCDLSSICQSLNDVSDAYEDSKSISHFANNIPDICEFITASTNNEEVLMLTSNREVDMTENINITDLDLDEILKHTFHDSNTFLVIQHS